MRYRALRQLFLTQAKKNERTNSPSRLLIFMHDFPDPDSITSALLLKRIAKNFAWNSVIVYGGKLLRSENIKLVQHLNIPLSLYQPGQEEKFSLTALVDCQKEMANNSFPSHLFPSITFDHHQFKAKSNSHKNFCEIKTDCGATASLLMHYLLHYKIPLSRQLATSFCYTLTSETNYFSRQTSDADLKLYKKAIPFADLRAIAEIQNTEKSPAFFKALQQALASYKIKHQVAYACLGELSDPSVIHQVADLLLTLQEVRFSFVTGTIEHNGRVCSRSKYPKVQLGKIIKKILKTRGNGGGHDMMAAGDFTGREEEVVLAFLKQIQQLPSIQTNS